MRFPSLFSISATVCILAMSVIGDDIPVPGFADEVPPANYDEAKIPAYTLPDPLKMADGRTVASAETWEKDRRPEILGLFADNMYGKTPAGRPTGFSYETTSEGEALGGKALRREVRLYADAEKEKPLFDVLIYYPKNAGESNRVPVALCLNFNGNHTISTDPGITLGTDWVDSKKGDRRLVPRLASDADRGNARSRWPLETIIDHGYALVTAYYCQIEPDFDGGIAFGVRRGMPRPKADEWGAIGAWAWGLSRIMDYIEENGADGCLDAKKVMLLGHSRLGKTALWAGAQDWRFAIVVSNNSGCGGAALSRRAIGETIHRMNVVFPHWCCGNCQQFNERMDDCPVDQHELLALIAPRPVYVASAAEDLWADPLGEFLSCVRADPVYRLLGTDGFDGMVREGIADGDYRLPPLNTPVGGRIGYHIRPGKHDVTDYDWKCYLDFADKHFKQTRKF